MPKQVRHDTLRTQHDKIGPLSPSKQSPQPLLLFEGSGFNRFCTSEVKTIMADSPSTGHLFSKGGYPHYVALTFLTRTFERSISPRPKS